MINFTLLLFLGLMPNVMDFTSAETWLLGWLLGYVLDNRNILF